MFGMRGDPETQEQVSQALASRGLRFFLEATLLYWAGPPVRAFIETKLELVTLVAFVLLFGGFIALKYIF